MKSTKSTKRSRSAFEESTQLSQTPPFVLYGTPLAAQDSRLRDDGSFVPIWKQEVRDERGRKRLHGAFTGGWSAGYFNTVGSKDGWAPSAFISSRTSRQNGGVSENTAHQRIEDFMDEEDLADAAEARKLETANSFTGLGDRRGGLHRPTGLTSLFHVAGETMGTKLLQRMGWRLGQGVGPKIRRSARLGLDSAPQKGAQPFLFAPEDVPLVHVQQKLDRMGLGFHGAGKLTASTARSDDEDSESNDDGTSLTFRRPLVKKLPARKPVRGGIGVGVLNDTGSDDEDPFDIGPKLKYNRAIGVKRQTKKPAASTHLAFHDGPASKSVSVSFGTTSCRGSKTEIRTCHDGRLPIPGFRFGSTPDPLMNPDTLASRYPPPVIPVAWKPSRSREVRSEAQPPGILPATSTALDPSSRAEILGESALPGKSVFDFLSPAARDRLAAVTGKSNLPPGRGEVPASPAAIERDGSRSMAARMPRLEKDTAVAARARGFGPGAPYAEDEQKQGRYKSYLDYCAKGGSANLPRPQELGDDEWLQELHEFYSCARIFRPMAAAMASRFTTSTARFHKASDALEVSNQHGRDSRSDSTLANPAVAAANIGMYGPMTRTVENFYPTRLLCKRLNVKPPTHVLAEIEPRHTHIGTDSAAETFTATTANKIPISLPMKTLNPGHAGDAPVHSGSIRDEVSALYVGRNEAIEQPRAYEDVFNAIFGDSDEAEC